MNSSPWKSWKIPSKLVGNFPACYVSFRGGSGFPTFRVEPPWFMDGFPGLDPIGLDPPILREFSFLSINDSKCLIWELSGSCDFRVWVWCGRFSGYHVFLLYTDGRPSISIMVLLPQLIQGKNERWTHWKAAISGGGDTWKCDSHRNSTSWLKDEHGPFACLTY